MQVKLICCNDKVEQAILGSDKYAERQLKILARRGWDKYKQIRGSSSLSARSKEEYERIHYWYIHEVDLDITEEALHEINSIY